jgi:Ca2+-binding EF-hand superfamily protein
VPVLADDPKPSKTPDAEATFRKLDANGDSQVSKTEFRAFPALKNKTAADIVFDSIDTDKNAVLSLEEFKKWTKAMAEKRKKNS